MLTIGRRRGESVVLTLPDGRTVTVVVMGVHDGWVRLGFAADRDIVVDRAEVHEAKQRERAARGIQA